MNEDSIRQAINILKAGGLVAIPTETVYGLAADAKNPDALKKIFVAKNRPIDHPLIVHIGDMAELTNWARDISEETLQLAKAFWPGPLTLIFKKSSQVSDIITGGQDTIGIRMPNHPLTLSLLQQFNGAVAAPSANKFGRISPTTAKAVKEELGDAVDLILEGGQCDVGVESTILDVSQNHFRILRPGMISAKQIEDVLQRKLSEAQSAAPRVSGSMESHYAPTTKTYLISVDKIESFLKDNQEKSIALVAIDFQLKSPLQNVHLVTMSNNPKQYAHDLYDTLRELDKKIFSLLIIEAPQETSSWQAINDRLVRAATAP